MHDIMQQRIKMNNGQLKYKIALLSIELNSNIDTFQFN